MVESVIVPKTKIEIVEGTSTYGRFVAEPLESGFGTTLGNSLRRVLLSSLPGAAVTSVKIEDVQHEYSTLPHVKEDITEFLLNVKGIRLRCHADAPALLRLEVSGEGKVCAGDIQASAQCEIINPELHLVTLDSPEAKFSAEFTVERGKGYIPAGHEDGTPIGVLPVDAIFTPVRKVNYIVEHTRVGQRTDYDRLVLDVWTDGTLLPVDAVRQAAQVLVDQFFLFCAVGKAVEVGTERQPLALTIPAEQYNTPIEKLELSARTFNALKRSNINKVGEVLERSREELLNIRQLGQKSLTELYDRLASMGFIRPAAPNPAESAGAPQEKGEAEEQEQQVVSDNSEEGK